MNRRGFSKLLVLGLVSAITKTTMGTELIPYRHIQTKEYLEIGVDRNILVYDSVGKGRCSNRLLSLMREVENYNNRYGKIKSVKFITNDEQASRAIIGMKYSDNVVITSFDISKYYKEKGYCLPNGNFQKTSSGKILMRIVTCENNKQNVLLGTY